MELRPRGGLSDGPSLDPVPLKRLLQRPSTLIILPPQPSTPLSSQVVALMLRSNAKADGPELPETEEIDYAKSLNRALPNEVRVLGWTTAPPDFNAR